MKTVVLAGEYPQGTTEKLRKLLPEEMFRLVEVNTPSAFEKMDFAEFLILRIFKAPQQIIDNNPGLRMILRWGAGVDSVDLKAAGERGVLVTNTPGANADAVSDLALLFILAINRKLLCHVQDLSKGYWSKNTYLDQSYSLKGKHLGLIGIGNIGKKVALKAQCFGCITHYFDVNRLTPLEESEHKLDYLPLSQLLETSDIVSLHIPLNDYTKNIIGEEEINKMKDGAILLNTSRGGLVDEQALEKAVSSGKLAGAGLDCVLEEPLHPDNKLLQNPNIIVTPHIGGGTADIGDNIIPILVQDILDFHAGNKVQHVTNQQFLTKKNRRK